MNTRNTPASIAELYSQWVAEALEHARTTQDLSQAEIARKLGWSRPLLSKIKRLKGDKAGRGISVEEAIILSQITGYPLPVNLGIAKSSIMSDFIRLRVGVAAGLWREGNKDVSADMLKIRHFDTDPEYAGLQQYGRHIMDGHADLYVPKDFYVVCVNYEKARSSLNIGDTVMVERIRQIDDKPVYELTVRRIAKRDDLWLLDPVCSDPKRYSLEPIPYIGDTDALRLCDLIIARYAPN